MHSHVLGVPCFHRHVPWLHCSAGTLGIFLAATLARQGKKVAVVERGMLKGRTQEWNISRADMKVR